MMASIAPSGRRARRYTAIMKPRLLLSVRTAAEAVIALASGADIIDVKEPANGALGCASQQTIHEIAQTLAAGIPVSIALGEWREMPDITLPHTTRWVKVGWHRASHATAIDWLRLQEHYAPIPLVGVVYADHVRVQAPPLETIFHWMKLRPQPNTGILIDTAIKDGRGLLHWCSLDQLKRYRDLCHRHHLFLALAGLLNMNDIHLLMKHIKPDIIAVRGAACAAGQRHAPIQTDRVRSLAACLRAG
jgi:(5-formylfuran-3-yl)methyl phosphate synthase